MVPFPPNTAAFCQPLDIGVALTCTSRSAGCRQATASHRSTWTTDGFVSFLPPCAKAAFKIWVFFPQESVQPTTFNYGHKENSFNRMLLEPGSGVMVQQPGDVVVLNNLVYHSVFRVYEKAPRKLTSGMGSSATSSSASKIELLHFTTRRRWHAALKKGHETRGNRSYLRTV